MAIKKRKSHAPRPFVRPADDGLQAELGEAPGQGSVVHGWVFGVVSVNINRAEVTVPAWRDGNGEQRRRFAARAARDVLRRDAAIDVVVLLVGHQDAYVVGNGVAAE